ncbi:hypothetical protein [Crossiella sp. NPDC003009]
MAIEEKRAWILLVVAICGYGTYLVLVFGRAAPYVPTMLWTIGGGIVAGMVLHIVASVLTPGADGRVDQRDREIGRFGEHVGQSFVVLGGVGALGLALAGAAHFWIANAIYLAFVLSAVLGSTAKVVAYRRGFQPW